MRQVLLNSSGAFVTRVPRPSIEAGSVLVRTHYSLISVGTEIASLLPAPAEQSTPIEKVKTYGQLAKTYLGKALRDPRKAVERSRLIVRQRLARLRPPPPPRPLRQDQGWQAHAARSMTAAADGLEIVTDDSQFSYQCGTGIFAVPAGHAVSIAIKGQLTGGVLGIGLLSGDDGRWLSTTTLQPGPVDDILTFVAEGADAVRVVIANAGVGMPVTAAFDLVAISLLPPSDLPHSEMDQQGWNVGYSLAGEVIAVGSGVSGLAVGDLVACAGAGKANHADFVCVKRNLVAKLPSGCDPRWAATTTVGTIALQGVRRASPQLGETVAVLGLGLIGQITAQILRANGCTVIGFDLDADRVQRALALGMDVGSNDTDELKATVRDRTAGRGVDRVLITAATKSSAVVNLAMAITRQRGTVVLVGDVGLNVERAQFYRKEIDLLMSTSYGPGRYDHAYEEQGRDYPMAHVRWTLGRNMEAFLELIASGRLQIGPLIDKVAAVSEARTVYDDLVAGGATRPLGVLFRYDDAATGDDAAITLRGHRKPRPDLINYALVGAGAFGQSMLVPMMDRRPDRFHLKAVVSRDAVRGGNFARSRSVEILAAGIEPVLDNPEVDLLVIASRHSDHATQTIAGLRAGKNVFVEKPLALSWDELDEVERACRENQGKSLLMVGFNRRFSPAMQRLKQELDGRRAPLMAVYRLNGGYIPADHWIQTSDGGGRNIGEACHMYDCFRFLTGAPVADIDARAIGVTSELPYLANDNFSATLTYADGSVCTLIYTALGPKQGLAKERLEVFCDGQGWVLDDYKALWRAGTDAPLWQADQADKGHAEELSRLGDAIAAGTEAPISFEEIMESSSVALHVEDLLTGRS